MSFRTRLLDAASGLTYPPMLSFWAALAGIMLLLIGWRRLGGGVLILALAWSALWSIPFASEKLRSPLENAYPLVAENKLPRTQAIVVLGGGGYDHWIQQSELDPWQLRSSRLAGSARAWLSGRAPFVVLSGGKYETRDMFRAGLKLGIPAAAMIVEDRSQSTRGNAQNTAAIARNRGFEQVILVTSALHMPRAMLQFRAAGLDAIPMPTPESRRISRWQQLWLPSRSALWRSGRAFNEYAALALAHMTQDRQSRENISRMNRRARSPLHGPSHARNQTFVDTRTHCREHLPRSGSDANRPENRSRRVASGPSDIRTITKEAP